MVFVDFSSEGFLMQCLKPPPLSPSAFRIFFMYTIFDQKGRYAYLYDLPQKVPFSRTYRSVLVNNFMNDVTEPFFS